MPGQLPNVATSPDGSTTVVWAEQKAVGGSGVWAATRSAAGAWGAPVNISASAGTAGSTGAGPRVVIDQAGNTTVVWQVVFNLYSVTKPAGGDWGAPVEIWTGTAGQDHGLSGLGAAVDAYGGVTVVWRAGLNNNNVVYAKRRASVGKAVGEVTVAFTNGKGGADGRVFVATREGDGPGSGTTGTWSVVWGDEASGLLTAGFDHTPAVRTDWTANGLTGALNLRTWINYIGGNVGAEVSAGASRPATTDPYSFRFTVGEAWIDGVSGETVVASQGTLRYTYPSHYIDTRIVNPRIRIAADGESAVVVADGQASGTMAEALEKGELVTFPFSDRTLLKLDRERGPGSQRRRRGADVDPRPGHDRPRGSGDAPVLGRLGLRVHDDQRSGHPAGAEPRPRSRTRPGPAARPLPDPDPACPSDGEAERQAPRQTGEAERQGPRRCRPGQLPGRKQRLQRQGAQAGAGEDRRAEVLGPGQGPQARRRRQERRRAGEAERRGARAARRQEAGGDGDGVIGSTALTGVPGAKMARFAGGGHLGHRPRR